MVFRPHCRIARMRCLCPGGQLSSECRPPQCLLSSASVWTLATVVGQQTGPSHHPGAVVPATILNSMFIRTAEPGRTRPCRAAAVGELNARSGRLKVKENSHISKKDRAQSPAVWEWGGQRVDIEETRHFVPSGTLRVGRPLCPVLSAVRSNWTSHAQQRVGKKGASAKPFDLDPASILQKQMSHPAELKLWLKPLPPHWHRL